MGDFCFKLYFDLKYGRPALEEIGTDGKHQADKQVSPLEEVLRHGQSGTWPVYRV